MHGYNLKSFQTHRVVNSKPLNHFNIYYSTIRLYYAQNSPQTVFFLLLYNSVGDVCNNCTCEIGYYYSYIVEECICKIMSMEVNMHTHFNFNLPFIALDPEEVYQYEATVLEGCDPERNAEYRMIIAAETKALISEFFSNSESSE